MRIIVLFNLKAGADVGAYEAWARATDVPGVSALDSVHEFQVYRTSGLLGGGTAPYQYVEIIDIANPDRFASDASTEIMIKMASEFQAFADNPQFILTETLRCRVFPARRSLLPDQDGPQDLAGPSFSASPTKARIA